MTGYFSMRKQLFLFFVAVIILTLLPLSLMQFFARDGVRRNFALRSESKSKRIMSKIAYSVAGSKSLADRLAFFFGASFVGTNQYVLKYSRDQAETKALLSKILFESVIRPFFYNSLEDGVDVYASAVAFVPEATPEIGEFAPYFFRGNPEQPIRFSDLAKKNYDYTEWDWYKIPVATKKPYWSSPYEDLNGGGIMMITYSVPALVNDEVVAVVTVDISISALQRVLELENNKENSEGYCLLLMQNRYAVGSKSTWKNMPSREGVIDFLDLKNDAVKSKDKSMIRYIDYFFYSGQTLLNVLNEAPNLRYGQLLNKFRRNFKEMGVSIYDPELKTKTRYFFTPVEFFEDFIFVIATPEKVFSEGVRRLQRNMFYLFLGICIFVSPFILYLSKIGATPTMLLKRQADMFALGRFDYRLPEIKRGSFFKKLFGASYETAAVADALNNLGSQLQKSFGEIENTKREIIRRLALAAEYRDHDTGLHVVRVSGYVNIIAEKLGCSERDRELLKEAATMHDIGKIGIPDDILLKPGKMTREEFEVMKSHTVIGKKILSGSDSPLLWTAEKIAVSHHEKWNGSGYPYGLYGEAIPVEGRIVAVCDVFDALTSIRPYKEPWSFDKAMEYIKKESGSAFDPAIVELFIQSYESIKDIYERFSDGKTVIPDVQETDK